VFVLGGGDVVPKQGYQGHYASFDLSEHEEISHINIDKMDSVYEQLVTKIVRLATTPAEAEGKAVPLRHVIPPNAAIELCDSGMPVFARSGDTLQTIAAFFHMPLWSLARGNRTSDGAPLVSGQRVIVPWCHSPTSPDSRRPGTDVLIRKDASHFCAAAQDTLSALRQKRNQHWNATAVRTVGVRAKFSRQKAFLYAGLLPEAEGDQERADQRGDRADRDARCQYRADQSRIDRVANKPVRAGIDDPMAFLARNRV
jgi:hypothetical protein